MDSDKKSLLLRFFLDMLALVPIIIVMPILNYGPINQRGYFKDDESLMYPYYGNTVPAWVLYTFNSAAIIGVIVLFELMNAKKYGISEKYKGVHKMVILIYRFLYMYVAGFLATVLLTVIGKVTIGRLRPHFFDVCKPFPLKTMKNYVVEFECSEKEKTYELRDMRMSFPSGHSSVAMFNAFFLVIYVNMRLPSKRTWSSLAMLLQVVAFGFGLFVCFSRIMDNKHHWSDVLAGGILGMFIAYITPRILLRGFATDLPPVMSNSQPQNTITPTLQKPEDYDLEHF